MAVYLGSTPITQSYLGGTLVTSLIPPSGGGVAPPAPTLGAITVSPTTATSGIPYTGTSSGRTIGSTLALSGAGAPGLSIDQTTGAITGTPTSSGAVNVIETLAGATGSPKTSSNVLTVAVNIPFTSDASTYWWDFAANNNTVDSLGSSTMSIAPEQVGGKVSLSSNNKSLQPLVVTGGINFNQATDRNLIFDLPPTITNGKSGWYFAAVVTPTTGNCTLIEIARAASQIPSRGQLYISSSRTIVLKYAAADGSSVAIVFQSVALTLGVKVAIEVQIDLTTGTASLWINGASQTVTSTGLTAAPFPSTNPIQVTVGNSGQAGGISFDGVYNNAVFYDGVPSSAIRSSISAFEQTRQQAA